MKPRIDSRIVLYFILVVVGASAFLFTFFLPHPQGFYAFIVVAAAAGFGVSLNIHTTKRAGKQLVCPTGSDCNVVVTSRYSRFFGIDLEHWGMGYFSLIILAYLALLIQPALFTSAMLFSVVLFSVAAGLFSTYLLFVQAFLLRKWCIWCILTAMLSLGIFVTSLISADIAVAFIMQIAGVLEMIKYFGFAFGVGGMTVSILLFLHFLEGDASIDEKELNAIKGISELIWSGFALVLVSQFALFVSQPDVFADSGAFFAQIISLLVFAIAGAVLMIIYTPFLVYVPFQEVSEGERGSSFVSLRRPTFVLGAIALASWYFAFVMNFIGTANTSALISIFVAMLLFVALLAVFWDRSLHTKVYSISNDNNEKNMD